MLARHVLLGGVLLAIQATIGLASSPAPQLTVPPRGPGAGAAAPPIASTALGVKGEGTAIRRATPNSADLDSPAVASLLDEVLRASGLDDPEARNRSKAAFSKTYELIRKHVGSPRSPYRRGRRLHDALHRFVFRHYSPLADSLDSILEKGHYNCVSATLLYGIMGRALGLDLRVVETPHHIYLQLHDRDRTVDIETTSRMGYDFTGDLERFRRFTWAYEFASHDEIESSPYYRFERVQEARSEPVPLEQAAAFLWHNSAQKALARGDAIRAASYFTQEFKAYPQLAERLDGFATSLAKAFRIEYEAGRFESALRISRMEMAVFPHRTSSRDRMLAAATKRIQSVCESGEHVLAETILEDSERVLTVPADRQILEAQACPHIVAGAVRAADWDQAWRMVSLYQTAEPDRVEGERLSAWVLAREQTMEREAYEALCRDPLVKGADPQHADSHSFRTKSWGD